MRLELMRVHDIYTGTIGILFDQYSTFFIFFCSNNKSKSYRVPTFQLKHPQELSFTRFEVILFYACLPSYFRTRNVYLYRTENKYVR